MRKARATEPTAIPPMSCSEKRNFRPNSPLTAAPSRGSRGTSQMYLCIYVVLVLCTWCFVRGRGKEQSTKNKVLNSPLQQINLIHPNRFLIPVERDHDS